LEARLSVQSVVERALRMRGIVGMRRRRRARSRQDDGLRPAVVAQIASVLRIG